MKGLGFLFENEKICCACMAEELDKTEYPSLLLLIAENLVVQAEDHCSQCGLMYRSEAAIKAGSIILRKLKGETK